MDDFWGWGVLCTGTVVNNTVSNASKKISLLQKSVSGLLIPTFFKRQLCEALRVLSNLNVVII